MQTLLPGGYPHRSRPDPDRSGTTLVVLPAASTVIVADDNPAILKGLESALAASGYSVVTAEDGRAVMDLLDGGGVRPDLLVLDVMMPRLDGLEVLRAVRSAPDLADLPVMLITATADETLPTRAIGDGAVDFLAKPFRVGELLARVDAHVERHRDLRRARYQARVRLETIELIHELHLAETPRQMFELVAMRTAAILGVQRCSILTVSEEDSVARIAASSEDPLAEGQTLELEAYPEIAAALERGDPIAVHDVAVSPLFARAREEPGHPLQRIALHSVIVAPFTAEPDVTGLFVERAAGTEPLLGDEALELSARVVDALVQGCERIRALDALAREREHLHRLAHTDELTGCASRRALLEFLEVALHNLERDGFVSLAVFDVDHFKEVNDTFGHLAGDVVLRSFGKCLRESATGGCAGRLGGDEFVLVLPERDADAAVETVRARLAELPFFFGGKRVRISASAGIARGTWNESATDLIAQADAALYRAKRSREERAQQGL